MLKVRELKLSELRLRVATNGNKQNSDICLFTESENDLEAVILFVYLQRSIKNEHWISIVNSLPNLGTLHIFARKSKIWIVIRKKLHILIISPYLYVTNVIISNSCSTSNVIMVEDFLANLMIEYIHCIKALLQTRNITARGFMRCPDNTKNIIIYNEDEIMTAGVTSALLHLQNANNNMRMLMNGELQNYLIYVIEGVIAHVKTLGIYGGKLAVLLCTSYINEIKKESSKNIKMCLKLDVLITIFNLVQKIFEIEMKNYNKNERIYKCSSNKIQVLLSIFEEHKRRTESFYGLIFVQNLFTAKILNNIFKSLKAVDPTFNRIKSECLYSVSMPFAKTVEQYYKEGINLLIVSNTLDENIDTSLCNLVIYFDLPKSGNVHIGGVARWTNAFYHVMVNNKMLKNFEKNQVAQLYLENGQCSTSNSNVPAMLIKSYSYETLQDNISITSSGIIEEDASNFFKHWPTHIEKDAGSSNKQRIYSKKVPDIIRGQLQQNKMVYLHLINLKPIRLCNNYSKTSMRYIYSSQFHYGILTCQALPKLCDFSIYTEEIGEIVVSLKVNHGKINITNEQIITIRIFHYLIFAKILNLLKKFLVFNNDKYAAILLIVPVYKNDIDFNLINSSQASTTPNQKMPLDVRDENYLHKIVSVDTKKYFVTNICTSNYSVQKKCTNNGETKSVNHHKNPMLIGLPLSAHTNHLKPKQKNNIRMKQHLNPNHCDVYNFPFDLWIQAYHLPSILYRINSLLQTDELRRKIAEETGLEFISSNERPLVLDKSSPENKLHALPHQTYKDPIFNAITMNNVQIQTKKSQGEGKTDSFIDIMEYDITKSEFVHKNILLLKQGDKDCNTVPELADLLTALTLTKSNDIVNLERLEILGDTFLKFSITYMITLKYPHFKEGEASKFRGSIISNKNLFYVGIAKNIPGYLNSFNVGYFKEWKPVCFHVPIDICNNITNDDSSNNSCFSDAEQVSGLLDGAIEKLQNSGKIQNTPEQNCLPYNSLLYPYLELHKISDKAVADSIEALLGVYFASLGFTGALKLLEWLQIVPQPEKIEVLLKTLNTMVADDEYVNSLVPQWKEIEATLGYHFNNRAYLLQALTHSSYKSNHLTQCYQILEFLGDAILDFLITCYIYESCTYLNPGQLTDLRSALVNNLTLCSFTVRSGLHKHILFSNPTMLHCINKFVQLQAGRNFVIDDEEIILKIENGMILAEQVAAPKILGDVFEALAAAVFLDSEMNLEVVWNVFYPIMWNEIELFSRFVPKNAVRLLYEQTKAYPICFNPVKHCNKETIVSLEFTLNDTRKLVYGRGGNKHLAKKAAAKYALQLLKKCF